MGGFHRDIHGDQNHVLHFREYANKDSREAATGIDATHLHKVALQKDDNTLWLLVKASPVEWQGLGGSGGGRLPHEITMFGGVINSAGRPLDDRTGEPDLAWGYCDGRTYTAPDGRHVTTPDMRGRFPMGTGSDGSGLGDIGGASTVTQSNSQMKSHAHTVSNVREGGRQGMLAVANAHPTQGEITTNKGTSSSGGSSSMENRPPYMRVAFIMYL